VRRRNEKDEEKELVNASSSVDINKMVRITQITINRRSIAKLQNQRRNNQSGKHLQQRCAKTKASHYKTRLRIEKDACFCFYSNEPNFQRRRRTRALISVTKCLLSIALKTSITTTSYSDCCSVRLNNRYYARSSQQSKKHRRAIKRMILTLVINGEKEEKDATRPITKLNRPSSFLSPWAPWCIYHTRDTLSSMRHWLINQPNGHHETRQLPD